MKLPKEFSLAEIAFFIGGKVEGPADTKVSSFSPSPLEAGPEDLAVVFEPKLLKEIAKVKAGAVVVPEGVETKIPRIVVKRPLVAMQKMLSAIAPRRYIYAPGVHPTAVIDPTAKIAGDVAIGANVVIGPETEIGKGTRIAAGCIIGGKVKIGEKCLFHAGCLIADYVQIGNRVILQQGASIGSDGYAYVTEKQSNLERRMAGIKEFSNEENPHLKIPQIGTVIIEDDVEIGSNTTIDRATIGATKIGRGTKIDNLVMIAHNCQIGREVLIVSQVGVAGSCKIGDRAILAGQCGVKDHITLAEDVIIEAKAGIMKDVPERGEVLTGSPAFPIFEFFTHVAHWRKAPQMDKDLKAMKKRVAELEELVKSLAPKERELVKSGE